VSLFDIYKAYCIVCARVTPRGELHVSDNIISWNTHALTLSVRVGTNLALVEAPMYFGPFKSYDAARDWSTTYTKACRDFWGLAEVTERFKAEYGDSFTGEDGSEIPLTPPVPGVIEIVTVSIDTLPLNLAQHAAWEEVIDPSKVELRDIVSSTPVRVAEHAHKMITTSFRE